MKREKELLIREDGPQKLSCVIGDAHTLWHYPLPRRPQIFAWG